MDESFLIPINEKFIEVFEVFMDDSQKNKIRANSVRQYTEGLIDLLLKDKIIKNLKPNEPYESVNWKRKLKHIKEYDEAIGNNIAYIFKVGGDGSHFSGIVEEKDLKECIEIAIHIVEDMFANYFCEKEHTFGTENVLRIFSMLPLKHRIYIMKKISKEYINSCLVDRLSLAYFKNGENEKAWELLNNALKEHIVDDMFVQQQLLKFDALNIALKDVQKLNSDIKKNKDYSKVIIVGNQMVTGYPSSKNIFETSRAVEEFSEWLKRERENYPEFINLFFYLMQTDDRTYVK